MLLEFVKFWKVQHHILKRMLNKRGYKYVHFGMGHKLKHHNVRVIELIASRFPFRKLKVGNWLVENRMGGGGFGAVYIPKLNTTVFSIHLALSTRKYFYHQVNFVAEKIKKTKGKIILIGDFNLSYQKIKNYFPRDLKLISDERNTCSTTPIMNWFFCIDCDHILAKGWTKKKIGEIKGYSDHKLLYADLV